MFLLNKQAVYLNFFKKKKNIFSKKKLKNKVILLKKKKFIRAKFNIFKPHFSHHSILLNANKSTVYLFIQNVNTCNFNSYGKTFENNFFPQ